MKQTPYTEFELAFQISMMRTYTKCASYPTRFKKDVKEDQFMSKQSTVGLNSEFFPSPRLVASLRLENSV